MTNAFEPDVDIVNYNDDDLEALMKQKISRMRDSDWLRLQIGEGIKELGSVRRFFVERFMTDRIGWNSDRYASFKKRQEEFDDYIYRPVEVIEGVLTCFKCKSKKILSTSSQTRAADEPMTVFAKCTECKNRWIVSD